MATKKKRTVKKKPSPTASPRSHDETRYPHASDVLERETSDNAFSAGWGLHHQPAESYIIDCHTHMRAPKNTSKSVRQGVADYYARAGAMRLRRHVALDGNKQSIEAFARAAKKDDRFLWKLWLWEDEPDLKLLKKAAKLPGFVGLKLHNVRMIKNNVKPTVWRQKKWAALFDFCGEIGKPVLWHVTQRLTDCPYMGGGRDSYWQEGWSNGTTFGNQELLDVFLACVQAHPQTDFIGAHHLHIGPESMAKLFRQHANLYTDLSCGNIVRAGDTLYPADAERWRKYTVRWQERVLFGTDCILGAAGLWYLWETLAAHIRFIHQLNLPKAALEKVMHENYERLAGLESVPLNAGDWQAVRP